MTLIVPILFGSAALAAGAAGLWFRKGSRAHAAAGTIFFVAMLVMAGTGALVAALGSERGTAVIGLFTLYLVATSWATARRRDGTAGRFEVAGLLVASACAAAFTACAVVAANSASGRLDSLPAAAHYPFAIVAALAAGLDLNFILRRRLLPRQRLARHLWRMCAAFLIAAFSFFMGQQKVMPDFMRGSLALFLPEIAILGAMTYWLVRLRLGKKYARLVPARAAASPGQPLAPAKPA